MSTPTPTLRAHLTDAARNSVNREDRGYRIGMTNISVDQGLMSAQITWGVDGTDHPISPEVKDFVDSFSIFDYRTTCRREAGIYVLYGQGRRKQDVLARARVQDYNRDGDSSQIYVHGKKREDVVKLYELVRDGKVRPDAEHGEFKQIEGALGELRRLRRQVSALKQRLTGRDGTIELLNGQLSGVRRQLAEAQRTADKR